jgi:exodeoxyribonuclease VII large subunit
VGEQLGLTFDPDEPDPSDEVIEDDVDPTWTVSELNGAIALAFKQVFGDEVWVRGEIRSISRPASGHLYLELTEHADGGESTLRVTLFRGARMRVEAHLARHNMELAEGIEIRICGQLDYYAPRGQVSLRMTGIDTTFTLGALAASRDALIRRLTDSGLAARNARRPVPVAPLRIGLVTSAGSAAFHDFVDELAQSGFAFDVVFADARVQGIDAPESIAAAIGLVAQCAVDVVCVVRGGGSRTDLAAWDTEPVSMAIVACPVPVFVGVGHEIDSSVADLVAHTSLKTPTACAQALVAQVGEFLGRVETAADRIVSMSTAALDRADAGLHRRATDVRHRVLVSLDRSDRAVTDASVRLKHHASVATATADRRLDDAAALLRTGPERRLAAIERDLVGVGAVIHANDPARLLERGWSITTLADGRSVRSIADAPPGTDLVTRLLDGSVTSTVSVSNEV